MHAKLFFVAIVLNRGILIGCLAKTRETGVPGERRLNYLEPRHPPDYLHSPNHLNKT